MHVLLTDEDYREALAEHSYIRERAEQVAADQEHDCDAGTTYFVVTWECLSDDAKRPYRTTVATVCDSLLSVAA